MTLYEYRCIDPHCRTRFEEWGTMATCNKPKPCPICGRPARRLISPPQDHKQVWSTERTPEELRNTKEIWE